MGRWIWVEDDVGGQFRRSPVVDARALHPVTAGQPLPGIDGGIVDKLVDAPGAGQGLDLLGLGYRDDVAQAELFEQMAEVPVLPVCLVRGGPRGRQAGCQTAANNPPGELALDGKAAFVRDFRRPAPITVGGPGLRQVELSVDQGPA